MPLEAVRRVGPYEIVSTLGGGSMGEVYVAHDPRLGRNVALKVLAAESLHDPLRRRRFAQEARSASALNHPNIVTIHDFGTMDGISYIVSELVEGQSLRGVIRQGPVPIRQLLEIAVQIASGLAAAHSAGIVHRDLKPENIMITSDGRVKILDFGLAKAIEDSPETLDGEVVGEPTSDGLRTQPGLILGTVGYMSPEQARGMPVSFQTDQFSFGVILHEMATGQQPFRRATPMQTLLEIANLSRLPFTPGPVGFRLVVERCLAREPEQRFGSTREIQERLQRIRDELPDKPARQAARAPLYARLRHSIDRRTAVRALWIILVFCLGLVAARLLWPPGAPSLSQYKFTPLAAGGTLELLPAISPNGNTITYAAAADGVFHIFTRPLKGSLATQLTNGPEDCLFPSWSPDGTRVYYISDDNLWSVGASGGSPELMFENVTRAAVSPDGSTLAMLRHDPPHGVTWSLWYSRSGSAPVRYENGPLRGKRFLGPSYIAFSPDGSKLGVWASSPSGGSEFWLIPSPTGQPRRHVEELPHTSEARMFAWMPDSRHIVFSDDHLWLANIANGRRQQITTGTGHEEAPAVVPGGKVIAFASTVHGYGLREIPLSGGAAGAAAGAGWQASPAWSPVRDEYAYVSSVSGAPEIWLKDAQSGWQRRIIGAREFPNRTSSLDDVSFSPDGQRIAYTRSGDDSEAIWISPLSGEAPVRIAREPSDVFQRAPTWSPDGNWIAYSTIRNGRYALMKARSDGTGQPLLMREDAGFHPAWSPEGHSLATLAADGLFIVAADGSSIRHIASGKWMCATWTRHGSEIFGIRKSDRGELELAVIAPDGANEQMKADLGPYPAGFSYGSVMDLYPVSGASLSPDGKSLLTSMLNTDSSLWLLEGFTK